MALTEHYDYESYADLAAIGTGGGVLAVNGSNQARSDAAFHGNRGHLSTNGGYITLQKNGTDNGAFSIYFEMLSTTTGVPRIITFTDASNTFIGMIRAHTDGKFDIANGSSTRVAASTANWSTGTKYRADGFLGGSGTARTVTLKIFVGESNTSPVWDTGGAVAITSATAGAWARARVGGQGATAGTIRIDDARFYDTQVFAGPMTSNISGTGVAALPAPAATLLGVRTVFAAAAAIPSGPVAALAGSRSTSGSGSAVLGTPAATLVGTRAVSGSGAAALSGPTGTMAGTRSASGSGSAVLGAPIATMTGSTTAGPKLDAVLPPPAATMAGQRLTHGSGSATLPSPVAHLSGTRTIHGTVVATLGQVVARILVASIVVWDEEQFLTLEDLMYARETQEEIMLDTLRIRHREPEAEESFDTDLGYEPSTPSDWFYVGKGRMQARPIQSGSQTAGEQTITVLGYIVAVPWDVTDVRPTDIVECLESLDPVNVGKVVSVSDVQSSSFVTARRMACVNYQPRNPGP